MLIMWKTCNRVKLRIYKGLDVEDSIKMRDEWTGERRHAAPRLTEGLFCSPASWLKMKVHKCQLFVKIGYK